MLNLRLVGEPIADIESLCGPSDTGKADCRNPLARSNNNGLLRSIVVSGSRPEVQKSKICALIDAALGRDRDIQRHEALTRDSAFTSPTPRIPKHPHPRAARRALAARPAHLHVAEHALRGAA